MKLGLAAFVTDYSMPIMDLAPLAESLGFDSLLVTEHTHIPSSRESPYIGGRELPEEYRQTYDPFVVLSAAAAVTTTLRIGTGVCLVTERDPIVLAKEVASLDRLSAGRFVFGAGAGWNAEEMRNHGTDPARRWSVVRDRIAALRTIWTQDAATYHGPYVDFDAIWSWPKPIQHPGPPVLLGGGGPGALSRVVSYGDGWMPMWLEVRNRLPEMLADLRVRAEAAERREPPVTIFWAPPRRDYLLRLADLGVECALLGVPVVAPDEVRNAVEGFAQFVGQVA